MPGAAQYTLDQKRLSVGLRHSLQLILLLDGVAARGQASVLGGCKQHDVDCMHRRAKEPLHCCAVSVLDVRAHEAERSMERGEARRQPQCAWCNTQHVEALPYKYLLEDPFAALMSSSARHSAMVLMLRKAASRAPVVIR